MLVERFYFKKKIKFLNKCREKTLTNQLSFYQSELTKIQYLFESTQSELIDLKTKYGIFFRKIFLMFQY